MSNYSKENDLEIKDYVHNLMAEAGWDTYKQTLTETLVVLLRGKPEHMTEKQAEEMDHQMYHASQVAMWFSGQMTREEFKTCQHMAQGIVDGEIVNEKFLITCPQCNETTLVHHLNWVSAGCPSCDTDVEKEDWKIESANE